MSSTLRKIVRELDIKKRHLHKVANKIDVLRKRGKARKSKKAKRR